MKNAPLTAEHFAILLGNISELTKTTRELKSAISELRTEVRELKAKPSTFDMPRDSNIWQSGKQESVPLKDQNNSPLKNREANFSYDNAEIDDTEMKDNFMSKVDASSKNITFLTNCFQEQIGVEMDEPQSLNIFNFDERLIAKGFDRVMITWQGVFWEHSRQDICFKNLRRVEYPEEGIVSWKANGVQVFQLTRPDERKKPRAHRFAVNSPKGFNGPCKPLKVGKFYSHVYQTKIQIGRELKTIQSKRMAKELKRMCGDSYRPRRYDLEEGKSRKSLNEPSERLINQNYRPQTINYKPLAEIQTVPPYGSFYNTTAIPVQNLNQQLNHPNQSPTNPKFSSNGINYNPNNNKEIQNTPLVYNQTFPNPQMNKQSYPSLFLPTHQYRINNQTPFQGNNQTAFFR